MDNVLFVGYTIDNKDVKNTPGASVAGNKMQYSLLNELSELMDIQAITIYPTAAYPKGELVVKRRELRLFDKCVVIVPGYINIPFYKIFSSFLHTLREIRKVSKDGKIKTVIAFNMFPYTSWPIFFLKRKFGYDVVCILADLPIDDNIKTKGIRKFLRKKYDGSTRHYIRKCDRIIALNEAAVKEFALDIPYMILEGGVNPSEITNLNKKYNVNRNILYSGSLQEFNGIRNLLSAMDMIEGKSDLVLDIYGCGEMAEYVRSKAAEHKNINYYGSVDNQKILELQQDAFLLINPRDPQDPISRVTFPSKTFEYLLSGTPVLSTRLNGYSEEYLKNMFIIDDNKPETIAEMLIHISSLSNIEMKKKGMNAREMVLQKKTWNIQARRVVQWLRR